MRSFTTGRPAASAAGRFRVLPLPACGGDHTPPVKVLDPTPDPHGTRLTTPSRDPELTLTVSSKDYTADPPKVLRQDAR